MEGLTWRSALVRGCCAGVLVIVLTGVPRAASASGDDADNSNGDAGQLGLNTAVLVNDSVGEGYTGDFPIRGSLFSADLSARVQEQREASTEQVAFARTLNFARSETNTGNFHLVRAALFENYSSQEVPRAARETHTTSSVLYGVAAVLAVPVVVVVGLLLGVFWVRRKRVAS